MPGVLFAFDFDDPVNYVLLFARYYHNYMRLIVSLWYWLESDFILRIFP